MATIEDLSPELLVWIFSQYIDSEGHVAFSKNVAPVCNTWWSLWSTPSLWKRIVTLNWKHVISLSKRGLLYHTEALEIQDKFEWELRLNLSCHFKVFSLDPTDLLAVLSSIKDLKALQFSCSRIDANMIRIVAKHCPNLERLCMLHVHRIEPGPITLEELSPILTTCGPKLKHLNLCRCYIKGNDPLFSEITAKCTSLEVFEWEEHHYTYAKFPIYKLMRGCPRLRKLDLRRFDLVTTGGNDCSGFRDLTVFKAHLCNFHGLDICSLLKNSNNLEHLELVWNKDMIFYDVANIPSNKVRFLELNENIKFKVLKQAIDKWNHTLLHLKISQGEYNFTKVLKTYLDNNPCIKLQVLDIGQGNLNESFFKILIEKCQNLKKFAYSGLRCTSREDIMNFYYSF